MRKIRIGKDIALKWTVLTNGEAVSLEGRDLRLELVNRFDKSPLEFTVSGDVVSTVFRGAAQKIVGDYSLTLWENYGLEGQTVVDSCPAFCLVRSTLEEGDGGECSNLETETVDLESSTIEGAIPGPPGKAFTFDDFTPEQIAELQKPATEAAAKADVATAAATEAASAATSAATAAVTAKEDTVRATTEAQTATIDANNATAAAQAATKVAEEATAAAEEITEVAETAEAGRVAAENARISAEALRAEAETTRLENEAERVSSEAGRAAAEDSRQSAETERTSAESSRISAEALRAEAESGRAAAETERAAAETARVEEYGQFKLDINEGLACIEGYRDLLDWEEDSSGGSVRAYKAGEYCKHPWTDPDTGETKTYVFRFLSSVAVGDAWDADKVVQTSVFGELKELVIGDTETLVIGISSSDGLLGVSGVSVIVKNITKGSQQTLVTNESGIVTVQIDKGDLVDIEAAQQSGYQKPGTVRHKATLNTAYVYVVYQKAVETCTVTVKLRTQNGAVIGSGDIIALNISDATSMSATVDENGNAVFEGVPQGHTGTVRVTKHAGYVTPSAQSFDTSHATVALDFIYVPAEVGIFMVRDDGQEFLLEDWNTEDALVAIHVNTQELADNGADYYVKPETLVSEWFTAAKGGNKQWSKVNVEYPNVPKDSTTDWDGMGNTVAMIQDAKDLDTETPAAVFAVSQTFTLGGTTATGFIGTKNQMTPLFYNNDVVEAMLTAAGYTPNYKAQVVWSSTQYSATGAWICYRSGWYGNGRTSFNSVVPFFAI